MDITVGAQMDLMDSCSVRDGEGGAVCRCAWFGSFWLGLSIMHWDIVHWIFGIGHGCLRGMHDLPASAAGCMPCSYCDTGSR